MTLLIGAVRPFLPAGGDEALVNGKAVVVQAGENIVRTAFHLPLLIGILQPNVEHAAGGPGPLGSSPWR